MGFDFNDVGQALRVAVLSLTFFTLFKEDILLNKVNLTRIHTFTNLLKRLQIITIYQRMVVLVYLADTFPSSYRDQLFKCNIHQHEVLIDFMERSDQDISVNIIRFFTYQ